MQSLQIYSENTLSVLCLVRDDEVRHADPPQSPMFQTCDGASDDLVGEVGEDEDPGQSNSHQHPHVEQVWSGR